MKKILMWMFLLFKRQLKNPAVVVFLLGLPIAAAIIVNTPQMTRKNLPRIGLVETDSDEVTKKTVDSLLNGKYSVEFYVAQSEDDLIYDVKRGDAECGYVFSKDMTSKLDSKKYNGSIIVVKNESAFISSMANEIVFSRLLQAYGVNVCVNYVEQSRIFKNVKTEAIDIVRENYEKYVNGSVTFHVDFEMLSEGVNTDSNGTSGEFSTEQIEVNDAVFPIRGILAVFVYIAGLFGAVMWKKDSDKGVLVTVPYNMRFPVRVMYVLIPTFLFAVSAELTLALTKTAAFPFELLKMFMYVVMVTAFGVLSGFIFKDGNIMISAILVLIILSLIVCPVFFNISEVVPAAKIVRMFLMPYYYLM